MRIHYQTWVRGKHKDIWIEDLVDQGEAIVTAFASLANRTVNRPIPEVEIYDDNQKLIYLVRANEYSDGQQDYIVTPQKEELYG